jgi:hypothetical protein
MLFVNKAAAFAGVLATLASASPQILTYSLPLLVAVKKLKN